MTKPLKDEHLWIFPTSQINTLYTVCHSVTSQTSGESKPCTFYSFNIFSHSFT